MRIQRDLIDTGTRVETLPDGSVRLFFTIITDLPLDPEQRGYNKRRIDALVAYCSHFIGRPDVTIELVSPQDAGYPIPPSLWKKLRAEGLFLPFIMGKKIKQAAAMTRHRNVATMGPGARVLVDGWINNPTYDRDRIHIGDNSVIRGDIFVGAHAGQISMGKWCFVGQQSYIWSYNEIVIGNRCLISHQVNIHDNNSHSIDPTLRHQHFRAIATTGHPTTLPDVKSDPITIGNDVWIGHGSTIRRGVHIGDRAIIAANAVVLNNVPADAVARGFPAQIA